MRVGTKIKLVIFSLLLLLIGVIYVFFQEYKTRDNATHLLLLTENYRLLEKISVDLKKISGSQISQQSYLLEQIELDYKKVNENTTHLLNGGEYHFGNIYKEIIPVSYKNIRDSLIQSQSFTHFELHKIRQLFGQDSLVLTKNTLTLMLEHAEILRNKTKRDIENYYRDYVRKMDIINKGFLVILVLILVITIWLYLYLNTKILSPHYYLRKALISTSYENDVLKISQNTLFKDIGVYLNSLQKQLHTSTDFINAIGNSDFEVYLEGETTLAVALRKMQSKLRESSQQEIRTSWTSQGLASLATIIRNNTDNVKVLTREVLKMVVNYLECEQGVIYVKKQDTNNSEENYFSLINHHGLSKERYKNIDTFRGEGLIGELLDNPQTIFITDLPEGYSIMSGLGASQPNCLLIIPLLTNQGELVGALELTSFKTLKSYEIELVEQMGESIATSMSSVLNTFHTKELLTDSQELTKRLRNQEEHMLKNMAALQNAQEEMARNQVEIIRPSILASIDQTLGTIEASIDGRIISTNKMILEILNFNEKDIIQKSITQFLPKESTFFLQHKEIWRNLLKNNSVSGDYEWYNKEKEIVWLNLTLTPVKNQNGDIFKIIILAKNVTQRKKEELEIQRLSLVADTTDNAVLIVNNDGFIEYINPGFTKTTGYQEQEVIGKEPDSFLYGEKTDKLTIKDIKEKLRQEISFGEEVLLHHQNGEIYWASLFVTPVFNNDNNSLEKYIFLLVDITDTKTSELDYSYKMNAISQSNAMLEIDLDGKIINTNENFLKVIGYTKQEIEQQQYTVLMTEEEHKRYSSLLTVVKKGEFISGEYRRNHKSGKELWIQEVYNPIFDLEGQMIKIIVFIVDVTQERLLEIVSEEKDLELQEHSKAVDKTIASVEFDMEGKIIGANEIFLGVFGYKLNELLGSHESILLSTADYGELKHQAMWDNLKKGEYFEGEFKNIGKNKHPIWLKGTYNPIFNREGVPYKIKMLAQFTTDDKERETNLNGIVTAIKNSFLYVEVNPDLTIKSSNNLFLKYTGYKRMELRKKSILSMMKGENFIDAENLINTIQKGEPFQGKFILEPKENEEKTFVCFFHPIKDLQNHINKIIVFLT